MCKKTMYKLHYILTLLIYTVSSNVYGSEHTQLDVNNIKNISAYQRNNERNQTFFSNHEINEFVKEWNNAEPIGLCKYAARIWLIIEMHDGEIKKYRLNTTTIKENNDYCYELSNNYSSFIYAKTQ